MFYLTQDKLLDWYEVIQTKVSENMPLRGEEEDCLFFLQQTGLDTRTCLTEIIAILKDDSVYHGAVDLTAKLLDILECSGIPAGGQFVGYTGFAPNPGLIKGKIQLTEQAHQKLVGLGHYVNQARLSRMDLLEAATYAAAKANYIDYFPSIIGKWCNRLLPAPLMVPHEDTTLNCKLFAVTDSVTYLLFYAK